MDSVDDEQARFGAPRDLTPIVHEPGPSVPATLADSVDIALGAAATVITPVVAVGKAVAYVAAPAAQHRSQTYFASVFAARMASSHALNTYLVWLAFTSKSVSTAGWVLVARAVSALVVPAVVGHVHDRGRIGPWLRVCAVVEAVGALKPGHHHQ